MKPTREGHVTSIYIINSNVGEWNLEVGLNIEFGLLNYISILQIIYKL